MKPLFLLLLLPAAICHAEPSIKDMPWPKRVREFPVGEQVSFVVGRYDVRHRIPDDPAIQSAGGSGGPIVMLALRDHRSGWHTSFTTQSVGERLLVSWHGKPQIEIWGRGGGGSWTRELYRYVAGEYRSIRLDEFEHIPHHNNQNSPTATLPNAFHGKAPPDGDPTLYFVETRLPSTQTGLTTRPSEQRLTFGPSLYSTLTSLASVAEFGGIAQTWLRISFPLTSLGPGHFPATDSSLYQFH